ncbi:MAG TPA: PHP domain-containing protein [Gemmatimonadaceae bacterium]
MTSPAATTGAAVRIDLHAHSTASDGVASPTLFVETAARAGLTVVALTDHDTVDGVAEAVAAAEPLGVRVVPGVELSVMDGKDEVHLLGLHLADVGAIADALGRFREGRAARAAAMVDTLNTLGVPLTLEAVLAEAAGGAVGRPHVARAMVAGGWVTDLREAFDKWLGAGRPAYVEKPRLEVADGVNVIHRAGGLAVWAHPGDEGRRSKFERMVAAGIDGAEVRHPGHNASDVSRIGALVEFFHLVPSGGSDWHGATAGPRMLGAVQVPSEWLERHEERLAMRRRAVPVREE